MTKLNGNVGAKESISVRKGAFIVSPDDPILVTGAAGFIGSRVLQGLLNRGFRNLVCFVRPSGNVALIEGLIRRYSPDAQIRVIRGNLLCREDCVAACKDVALIFHLAAGIGEKTPSDTFLNSVNSTRELFEAIPKSSHLRRFVLVSSFAVYSNRNKAKGRLLDESSPLEKESELRGEAYSVAKVKQEQLVVESCTMRRIPYVVLRPGSVYGEGRTEIMGRVGLERRGFFLHLGGSNTIPITYVENCADAIILAGLIEGVEGEAFNVVDDDLPTSREFLNLYKTHVGGFKSIYLPHAVSYLFCCIWEKCSELSGGRLPLIFNRRRWHADWKRTQYTNKKLKDKLNWKQTISTAEGLRRYFESFKENRSRV
jgi:nucleoside-diphosphate-sugar epimerase